MAKKDDVPVEAFDDDGWDLGPPSARRSSLRPGARRSLRPANEAVLAVELQRKAEAKRVADAQRFVESGWSEPPQADDEPTLVAEPTAVVVALAASSSEPEAASVSDAPAAALNAATSVEPETPASRAREPVISAVPAPAVSVAPTVSASPAAPRAAVRPAATRTAAKRDLAQTALRAATPISFPAEARPSLPALSIPAAAQASMPAVVTAAVPAVTAVSRSAAANPALVSEAPSSGPHPEIASESPVALSDSHDHEPESVSGARLVHPSRRPPSPTASFRPVVPDVASARPMPRRRLTLTSVLPLVSLVLSTMGVGFLMFGGSPPAEATTPVRGERVAAAAPEPLVAKARERVAPARPATPPDSKKVAVPQPAAPARRLMAEPPPAAGAAAPSASELVQVELSVYPYDAAVGYLGIMQKGGPRYTFEVPKGKSIAVEVARKGYGTRKVTLDGTQPKLTIGLRKTKTSD